VLEIELFCCWLLMFLLLLLLLLTLPAEAVLVMTLRGCCRLFFDALDSDEVVCVGDSEEDEDDASDELSFECMPMPMWK
jgi:hypothetical protein